MNTIEFIAKANKIHNNKYTYENTIKGTIKLKRKGHTELITSNIQQFILPSVETIENTEEFKAISGSE